MFFSNIKGHKKNIEFLKKIVEDGNLSSSFLFLGPSGVGKKIVALEFARYILSYKSNDLYSKSIDEESVRMFERGVHPDFLLVDLAYQAGILGEDEEEQKSIKIDTIRSLIKFAYLAPSFSEKKMIIIDDADRMTVEAQNAILKTLEEPPSSTIIILIASNQNLLLPTIISRCNVIKFSRLSHNEVMDILIEKGFEFKKAELLSSISNGSVYLAMRYSEIIDMLSSDVKYGMLLPFIISSKISKRPDLKEFLLMLLNFINSYIYFGIKKGSISMEDGFSLIKENKRYLDYLRHNVNYRLILELSLYKFLKVFNYFKKGVGV